MPDDDSAREAALSRLHELRELVDHREFMATSKAMRVKAQVESQIELDDARDRLLEAVREARGLGMDWETIGWALGTTDNEAKAQFGYVDDLTPEEGQGPTHYEW